MLDDVAEVTSVATVAKPPVPRKETETVSLPDTKPALRYLACSDVSAISITTGNGHVVINVGYKPGATEIFWLPQEKAKSVAARARSIAGDAVDVVGAVAALREAAAQLRVTLTPHSIAISRGAEMAHRLDALMDALKRNGMLREFTKAYRRRRIAAAERGEKFMPFPAAELRLRRALIPLLMSGKPAAASIFAEVFGA